MEIFGEEYTKKRRHPAPANDQVLNVRDSLYGLDPTQIHPFENEPTPAVRYAVLNKDVVMATNLDRADGPDSAVDHPNCYSPTVALPKTKQETFSRNETKVLAPKRFVLTNL